MSTLRLPKQSYRNTNGFIDSTAKDVNEVAATSTPQVASNAPGMAGKTQKEIRDAISVHRAVEDMLDIKGSYFPGLEAMQAIVEKSDSYDGLEAHVKELEIRHEQEIAGLLDRQTRDYLLGRVDAYQAADGGVELPEVDRLLNRQADPGMPELTAMESEYETYRYLHLRALAGWTKRRDELREKEERERKERDAQFPQSIAQFNAIPAKEGQVRVARFLTADSAEKERMLTQFGWAYRQVKPLEDDFRSNVVFQADVRHLVREVEARDPRRKTS